MYEPKKKKKGHIYLNRTDIYYWDNKTNILPLSFSNPFENLNFLYKYSSS